MAVCPDKAVPEVITAARNSVALVRVRVLPEDKVT
jgi:hypothetical protein